MDTKFQESRDAMRAERFGSSKDHFVAGVKGLGMGLVGGLTSIVTQPIEGAHNSGVSVSALSRVIRVCVTFRSVVGAKRLWQHIIRMGQNRHAVEKAGRHWNKKNKEVTYCT